MWNVLPVENGPKVRANIPSPDPLMKTLMLLLWQ